MAALQMTETGYIHTFTRDEQDRLRRQAELLELHLHPYVDLSGCARLLEIGCGVGAQLRLLSRRYPPSGPGSPGRVARGVARGVPAV